MMANQHMAYSDQLILPHIERHSAARKPLTATELSTESGVAYGTVKRRLTEMERAGVIRRERLGRRWGSIYEIVVDDPPTG